MCNHLEVASLDAVVAHDPRGVRFLTHRRLIAVLLGTARPPFRSASNRARCLFRIQRLVSISITKAAVRSKAIAGCTVVSFNAASILPARDNGSSTSQTLLARAGRIEAITLGFSLTCPGARLGQAKA